MFSVTDQSCFDQEHVHRKCLISIGCTVAMVTTILLTEKGGKIATNFKNTFITPFLSRYMLIDIVYWIK